MAWVDVFSGPARDNIDLLSVIWGGPGLGGVTVEPAVPIDVEADDLAVRAGATRITSRPSSSGLSGRALISVTGLASCTVMVDGSKLTVSGPTTNAGETAPSGDGTQTYTYEGFAAAAGDELEARWQTQLDSPSPELTPDQLAGACSTASGRFDNAQVLSTLDNTSLQLLRSVERRILEYRETQDAASFLALNQTAGCCDEGVILTGIRRTSGWILTGDFDRGQDRWLGSLTQCFETVGPSSCTSSCPGPDCREGFCDDDTDNDEDGLTDCADPDCAAQSCGDNCTCTEECTDGADNDGDQLVDCAAPDCAAQSCGVDCTCGDPEICSDMIDNNGNLEIDCAEASCDAMSCGTGCVCGGSAPTETTCDDGADNDGDTLTDCADGADCNGRACGPAGQVCMGGMCGASGQTLRVQLSGTGTGTVTSTPPGIMCPPTCEASFPAASNVQLDAQAGLRSGFTGWQGGCAGEDPSCTVALTQAVDVTASFLPSLQGLWARGIGTNSSQSSGHFLAVDRRDGRAAVAGRISEPVDFGSGVVMASRVQPRGYVAVYNPSGSLDWVHHWAETRTESSEIFSSAFAPNGDVVVAGRFGGTVDFGSGPRTAVNSWDAFVFRVSRDGRPLWANSFSSASGGVDAREFFARVSVDPSGDVYALARTLHSDSAWTVGALQLTGGPGDFVLVKLAAPTGAVVWGQRYGGAGHSQALISGLSAVASGEVAVLVNLSLRANETEIDFSAGTSTLTARGSPELVLSRYDPSDGTFVSTEQLGGAGRDGAFDMTGAANGAIAIAGFIEGDVRFGATRATAIGRGRFIAAYRAASMSWEVHPLPVTAVVEVDFTPDGRLVVSGREETGPQQLGDMRLPGPGQFIYEMGGAVTVLGGDATIASVGVGPFGHVTAFGFLERTLDLGNGATVMGPTRWLGRLVP